MVTVQLNDYLAHNSPHIRVVTAESQGVYNDIMISMDKGNSEIPVLLDLSAAFDTDDHDLLLSELLAPFLTGSSPINADVYNLPASINFIQRNLTCSSD